MASRGYSTPLADQFEYTLHTLAAHGMRDPLYEARWTDGPFARVGHGHRFGSFGTLVGFWRRGLLSDGAYKQMGDVHMRVAYAIRRCHFLPHFPDTRCWASGWRLAGSRLSYLFATVCIGEGAGCGGRMSPAGEASSNAHKVKQQNKSKGFQVLESLTFGFCLLCVRLIPRELLHVLKSVVVESFKPPGCRCSVGDARPGGLRVPWFGERRNSSRSPSSALLPFFGEGPLLK